jgi:hypothetical protein
MTPKAIRHLHLSASEIALIRDIRTLATVKQIALRAGCKQKPDAALRVTRDKGRT